MANKQIIDVMLGEASPGSYEDYRNIASVIVNRAVQYNADYNDVANVKSQFNAQKPAPGTEKHRATAERAWNEVINYGTTTNATYYATPVAVRNLKRGSPNAKLQKVDETVGHQYFVDKNNAPIVTAAGVKRQQPGVQPTLVAEASAVPTTAPKDRPNQVIDTSRAPVLAGVIKGGKKQEAPRQAAGTPTKPYNTIAAGNTKVAKAPIASGSKSPGIAATGNISSVSLGEDDDEEGLGDGLTAGLSIPPYSSGVASGGRVTGSSIPTPSELAGLRSNLSGIGGGVPFGRSTTNIRTIGNLLNGVVRGALPGIQTTDPIAAASTFDTNDDDAMLSQFNLPQSLDTSIGADDSELSIANEQQSMQAALTGPQRNVTPLAVTQDSMSRSVQGGGGVKPSASAPTSARLGRDLGGGESSFSAQPYASVRRPANNPTSTFGATQKQPSFSPGPSRSTAVDLTPNQRVSIAHDAAAKDLTPNERISNAYDVAAGGVAAPQNQRSYQPAKPATVSRNAYDTQQGYQSNAVNPSVGIVPDAIDGGVANDTVNTELGRLAAQTLGGGAQAVGTSAPKQEGSMPLDDPGVTVGPQGQRLAVGPRGEPVPAGPKGTPRPYGVTGKAPIAARGTTSRRATAAKGVGTLGSSGSSATSLPSGFRSVSGGGTGGTTAVGRDPVTGAVINSRGVTTTQASSGANTTYLCTALYEMGYLPRDLWRLDGLHGMKVLRNDPDVYNGYALWGAPLAEYIKGNRLGNKLGLTIIRPLIRAWAQEMAHLQKPERYKSSLLGKALNAIGTPICRGLGRLNHASLGWI